jgi:hypothetical protein
MNRARLPSPPASVCSARRDVVGQGTPHARAAVAPLSPGHLRFDDDIRALSARCRR